MKYFKITLRQNPGSTALVYPDRYQSEIGNFNKGHLYYDDDLGNPMLLLSIEDKNSSNIVRDNVVEITEAEAKAISEAKEVRTEQINDEAKIRRLAIKAQLLNTKTVAGTVTAADQLTTDELKALDPKDATSGIVMSKILADKIEDLKKVETAKVEAEKIKVIK